MPHYFAGNISGQLCKKDNPSRNFITGQRFTAVMLQFFCIYTGSFFADNPGDDTLTEFNIILSGYTDFFNCRMLQQAGFNFGDPQTEQPV
mgnify:CR=1 FL=1